MPLQSRSIYWYAATYSLVAPIGPAALVVVSFFGDGRRLPHWNAGDALGLCLVLTITALLSGLFSLFGLDTEPRRSLLMRAVPGIVIALPTGFFLLILATFVG